MLNTNEVRARAAAFAEDWKNAHYERGEAQSFYNDFFAVFGIKRRQVATFEEPVKKLNGKFGFIDLFWKGMLLVEHKSAGRSLMTAKEQALDYFPKLKREDLPRYVLVSDFQTFELYDLEGKAKPTKFKLHDLHKHVEAFNFIRGLEKREFRDQDPVNIKASELVGELHDALEDANYKGHDLERFLVRIVFCLFADDTGIFDPRNLLLDYLQNRTNEDGSDTGSKLIELFDVLNHDLPDRPTNLDEDLRQFPYVNGDLFADRLRPPSFNSKMRKLLIDVCEFRWDAISPAIFGALFQSVMDEAERRKKGAHYTTEQNILKVIRPLFLDALEKEFQEIKARRSSDRKSKLIAFHNKLSQLTFFDPACGCGNFLIITYRELRRLEIAVLKEIYPIRQQEFDVTALSKLDVDKFYGIEIEEFSARIAETAMWMMDHIMNNELSLAFGNTYARIPLRKSASIHNRDALEVNWADLLPAEKCSYVFGNPPFIGAKFQTEAQREQVRSIANLGKDGGTLDYVAAWFLKAGAYLAPEGCKAQIAFVATNSITQGEQVAQLWPILFSRYGLEINFAHRTFMWGSEVKSGRAHVHVVIIGLSKRSAEWPVKRLFTYDEIDGAPVESRHQALSPYLIDAANLTDRHLVVYERSAPLCDVPKLTSGSQPIDDGQYIFSDKERATFVEEEPKAEKYLRPYIGTEEFLYGIGRWILYLRHASPSDLRSMPEVRKRMNAVREYRSKSTRKSTLEVAAYPERFSLEVIPTSSFLAIPEVSSEAREYIPIGWLEPPIIPSNKLRFFEHADLWHFGIVTSAMHMVWTKFVGGRLESRFQYSIGINYNAFPWPNASESQKARIRELARNVLTARAEYHEASLAELYDSAVMKSGLRRAHHNLDRAVDALYKRNGFLSDRERVEHLFSLYENLTSPLTAIVTPARKSKRSQTLAAKR